MEEKRVNSDISWFLFWIAVILVLHFQMKEEK